MVGAVGRQIPSKGGYLPCPGAALVPVLAFGWAVGTLALCLSIYRCIPQVLWVSRVFRRFMYLYFHGSLPVGSKHKSSGSKHAS